MTHDERLNLARERAKKIVEACFDNDQSYYEDLQKHITQALLDFPPAEPKRITENELKILKLACTRKGVVNGVAEAAFRRLFTPDRIVEILYGERFYE